MQLVRSFRFVMRLMVPIALCGVVVSALPTTPSEGGMGESRSVGDLASKNLLELNQLSAPPKTTKVVNPVYPLALRAKSIQGSALIGFIVTTEGKTAEVYAIRADQPEFGEAAIAAVMQWEFEPPQLDGRPVNVRMQVPINFQITDEQAAPSPDSVAKTPSHDPNAEVVDLDELDQPLKPTLQVQAAYPSHLRASRIQGSAVVHFVVGTDGTVVDAEWVRAAHPEFGNAAVAAIRFWRFTPPQRNGQPVATRMQVPINFAIPGLKSRANFVPTVTRQTKVYYPNAMRPIGQRGEVIVGLWIDEWGEPRDVHVVRSDHPGFNSEAITAMYRWEFVAARGGSIYVQIPLKFSKKRPAMRIKKPRKFPEGTPTELQWDKAPVITHYEPPVYPRDAFLAGRGGRVVVEISLNPQGRVDSVQLVEGKNEAFLGAVAAAAQTWTFDPAMRKGDPVGATFEHEFVFDPKRSEHAEVTTSMVQIAEAMAQSDSELFPESQAVDELMPFSRPGTVYFHGEPALTSPVDVQVEFVVDSSGQTQFPVALDAPSDALGYVAAHAVAGWSFAIPRQFWQPVDTKVIQTVTIHPAE